MIWLVPTSGSVDYILVMWWLWYVGMCQQSVSDTVRQWPGVWQEVESAINISSQKLDFFSKSLHFVKGSLGKTQKTQHQYFLIMEVSLIVIFWYETCVLDFSKVYLYCLLCYLSKVLSTSLYSVVNTMCFGSLKSGSVCPHALEAFCSSKKDAPLWEWYTSRSSPRSHDSVFIHSESESLGGGGRKETRKKYDSTISCTWGELSTTWENCGDLIPSHIFGQSRRK